MTSKVKDNFIISFVFILIFLISAFILHNNVYCVDDLAFNFLDKPFDLNRELWYGVWVMKLQYILMYALPFKFDIDLNTWGMFFGTAFKAFVLSLFAFIFYKIFVFKGISKLYSSYLAFFFYILTFVFLSKTLYIDLILFSGFFRFFIPALCLYVSLYLIYKQFNGQNVNSFYIFMSGYFTGYSSELVTGIILTFSLSLLIYQFVINYNEEDKKFFKMLVPYSSLFFGLLLGTFRLISSYGFKKNFETKLDFRDIDISQVINSIPEFSSLMFKTIIIDYWYVWLILIIFFIYNFLKKDCKQNIFILFICLGILVFDFSLIILGKTQYSQNYWLVHNDIYTVYILVFMFIFALLIPPLMIKYHKTAIFKVFISVLCLLTVTLFTYNSVKFYEKLYDIKDFAYLRDKMVIFYALKNEPPILPISVHLFNPVLGHTLRINHKDINYLFRDLLNAKPEDLYLGYDEMSHYYYFLSYRVYIPEKSLKLEYMLHNDAMDIFTENGGVYDEVLNRTYKFSNLKDKNFVLNIK